MPSLNISKIHNIKNYTFFSDHKNTQKAKKSHPENWILGVSAFKKNINDPNQFINCEKHPKW
jgi:hypothetical protein